MMPESGTIGAATTGQSPALACAVWLVSGGGRPLELVSLCAESEVERRRMQGMATSCDSRPEVVACSVSFFQLGQLTSSGRALRG